MIFAPPFKMMRGGRIYTIHDRVCLSGNRGHPPSTSLVPYNTSIHSLQASGHVSLLRGLNKTYFLSSGSLLIPCPHLTAPYCPVVWLVIQLFWLCIIIHIWGLRAEPFSGSEVSYSQGECDQNASHLYNIISIFTCVHRALFPGLER